MIFFLIGVALLITAFFTYGKVVERCFGITDEPTPAMRNPDGVDFVPLSWQKAMLIQAVSIAGTGPIFGAIAGALWGYWAFIWIVLGCIFAGATHDYLAGMLSVRNNGANVSDLVGRYLGRYPKYIMTGFSMVLLVLVGTVFIASPANILRSLFSGDDQFFQIAVIVIILYYIIATVTPINQIIGRIYPVLGIIMILSAVGIAIMMFVNNNWADMPEATLANVNPRGMQIFPFLFITIACGAISGFHATQAPIMARCIKSERVGLRVFHGSMIIEGLIAMIWAAVAMHHFGSLQGLADAGAAPVVVSTVSMDLLGPIFGVIAVIGVVLLPITSGDTAFRACRMILADQIKMNQKPVMNRFVLAIPLFVIAVVLTFWVDFAVIWRYFAWSNQTLATIALWTGAVYLKIYGRPYWIAYVPATFMTLIVTSYIVVAPEGFQLPLPVGIVTGIVIAIGLAIAFQVVPTKTKEQVENYQQGGVVGGKGEGPENEATGTGC